MFHYQQINKTACDKFKDEKSLFKGIETVKSACTTSSLDKPDCSVPNKKPTCPPLIEYSKDFSTASKMSKDLVPTTRFLAVVATNKDISWVAF